MGAARQTSPVMPTGKGLKIMARQAFARIESDHKPAIGISSVNQKNVASINTATI